MSLSKHSAVTRRKPPAEILGLDLGGSGVKAVRLRKGAGGITVMRADILPAPEADAPADRPIGRELLTNYAALALSARNATLRILNMPGHLDGETAGDEFLREHMGLGEGHRVGFSTLASSKGRGEGRLLAVGLPEPEVRAALDRFAIGAPAPCSLEVSGLAVMTAFLRGPGRRHEQDAVGLIESGANLTIMALFHRGLPILVRKFDLGVMAVADRVQKQLGVDAETARGILADGSFDISQAVHDVVDPFLRQLALSREFVERREDCRLDRFFLSGGMSLSRFWMDEVARASSAAVETWDPFEGLTLAPGALPPALEGQRTRFAAAVGACLGVWEAA